jgi:hypothetical protein
LPDHLLPDGNKYTTITRKENEINQGEPSEPIIRKENYWTYIEPGTDYALPDEWGEHGGKLMVFANEQQIVTLAQRLSQYVAQGKIRSLKYAPPLPPTFKSWALMVYCLDSESDEVWTILQREGVKRKIWKYDKQTEMDWKPGGRLHKKLYGE